MEKSFKQKLRALRKKAGLNQDELAYLVGVHETTIRRWESINGKGDPGLSEIKKICEILNVSEAELLTDEANDDEWVLEIKMADNKKEVFDMAKGMPCIAAITTDQWGGMIQLAGSYQVFSDESKFKSLIAQLKAARDLVLQNGKVIGAFKDDKKGE